MGNDRIYAVGGRKDIREEEILRTAEVLDLTMGGTQEWRNIASMNTRRDSVAVAALNGTIYAVGGTSDGRESLSTVESYDPELDVWSPVGELSFPRSGAGVCVLDGVLYCVGGSSNSWVTNFLEKYDEDSNTWSRVADMNHDRNWPGVLPYKGRLYVVGEDDGEMYDPMTNTWTLMDNMSTG